MSSRKRIIILWLFGLLAGALFVLYRGGVFHSFFGSTQSAVYWRMMGAGSRFPGFGGWKPREGTPEYTPLYNVGIRGNGALQDDLAGGGSPRLMPKNENAARTDGNGTDGG